MTRTARTAAAALLVAALGVAAAPVAAGGGIVVREHFDHVDAHIEQEEHGPEWCPDLQFDVAFEGHYQGLFLGVARGDGLVYFGDRVRATETFTNVENGKTFTAVITGTTRDQSIVDNGDGTLTITVQQNGRTFYYGSDGERLFRSAGLSRFQILVDHGGTPGDPEDDEFLEFLGDTQHVGLDETAGRDFCADLQEFIG